MKAARLLAPVLALSFVLIVLSATMPRPVEASATSASQEASEAGSVIVELVVHEPSGKTRSYDLLTTTDGSTRRLSTGSRVAIQVKQSAPPDTVPLSSVQYQDIGFSAEVSVSRALNGDFRVRARIEDSVVNEEASGVLPQIDHHTQELQAIVPLDETFDATHMRGGEALDYRVTLQLRSDLR